jgi:hypothetical protein
VSEKKCLLIEFRVTVDFFLQHSQEGHLLLAVQPIGRLFRRR